LIDNFDIAIVGAGIAGASLAAEIGPHASVVLLEAEDQPGRHSTGRSAAFWAETYGGPLIQPLTAASGPWLAERGFLGDRGGLTIARAGQDAEIDRFLGEFAAAGVRVDRVDRAALEEAIPGLRPEWVAGVTEPGCKDIDVAGLHGWYLARARKAGVRLVCRAELTGAAFAGGKWTLTTADSAKFGSSILVDAAGAWADPVAAIAGVRPLGITPLRRTMVQLRTSPEASPSLPLVMDILGQFYFKPEGGRLWLSPHDEIPSPPCDAAPEELDVAVAIDRLEHGGGWGVGRGEHKWAGLRSVAPGRLPGYGADPENPAFFWVARPGGDRSQTAPAAGPPAAPAMLGPPADERARGLDPQLYRAARFF